MIDKSELFKVIDDYWCDFNSKRSLKGVVPGSIPIIWFGDIEAFFQSKIRTVTVSLNPSLVEFSSDSRKFKLSYQRFDGAEILMPKSELNDDDKDQLIKIYSKYFRKDPYYKSWFQFFDLKCMGFISKYGYEVGYGYNCFPQNTAIHIDYFSALATDPVYSDLKDDPLYFETFCKLPNKDLFKELLSVLKPDVILFSCGHNDFLDCMKMNFGMDPKSEPEIYCRGEKKKEIKLRSYLIDNKLVIHGRYMSQPFAPISDELKERFFSEVFAKYQFDYRSKAWTIK